MQHRSGMRILLTGATGFIGTHLVTRLKDGGHSLKILTRGHRRTQNGVEYFHWRPLEELPPVEALDSVDAVIHLAGESVAARWTAERKRRIYDSRVLGTRNLMKGVRQMVNPPGVVISASAVGYYGDRGDETLTEESAPGEDFLARVARDWEHEVQINCPETTRAVVVRSGLVLGMEGGAFPKILRVFKMGLGGPLGSGNQWMSWIHIRDLVSLYEFALTHSALSGPVNAVSRFPVRNREFAKAVGRVLGTPAFLPAPTPALKLVLGEMSSVLLHSQRVLPQKALASGFTFQVDQLENALIQLLKP